MWSDPKYVYAAALTCKHGGRTEHSVTQSQGIFIGVPAGWEVIPHPSPSDPTRVVFVNHLTREATYENPFSTQVNLPPSAGEFNIIVESTGDQAVVARALVGSDLTSISSPMCSKESDARNSLITILQHTTVPLKK
eukprot:PhF_6_TR7200/c0_g1_i1/m.10765